MQIFVLDLNPDIAAKYHCDKHVVKMVLEYAQLLSTAHRVLDGSLREFTKPNNKKQRLWVLDGEEVAFDDEAQRFRVTAPIYSATHINHPCAVWVRESHHNYDWLSALLCRCLDEYQRRYGKIHELRKLIPNSHFSRDDILSKHPVNIPRKIMTDFAVATPEEYKVPNDPVASYKAFYIGDKARFAKWTNTEPPSWFIDGVKDKYDICTFTRTR